MMKKVDNNKENYVGNKNNKHSIDKEDKEEKGDEKNEKITTSEKIQKYRNLVTIVGMGLMVISAILFFLQITFPELTLYIQIDQREGPINLTIVLWIVLFTIGTICTTRFFTNGTDNGNFRNATSMSLNIDKAEKKYRLQIQNRTKNNKSIKIISVAWSRLLAALIMGGVSVWNLFNWGAEITISNTDGNWYFLGGPTLFYPTGFFPLLFSAGLLIYFLLSISIIKITQTDEELLFTQQRYLLSHFTNINKVTIKKILVTNRKMGAMYIWVIALGIPMWFLFADGLTFLTNPHSFGLAITTGIHFVVQAFSLLIGLILLIRFQPAHLQISTTENEYILRFTPLKKQTKAHEKILKVLGNEDNQDSLLENIRFIDDSKISNNIHSKMAIRKDPRFIFGIIFLLTAIISRIFRIYAGEPLAISLFLAGIIFIIKSFKEHLIFDKLKGDKNNIKIKIDIFDILALSALCILSIINSFMMIWLIPTNISEYWQFIISHIIGLTIIFSGIIAIIKVKYKH